MENKYPYTDFHELNLDWFLNKFKELLDSWTELSSDNAEFKTTIEGRVDTLENTVETFTTFVTNYFEDLDVQTEINNKLNAMVEDGTLAALIEPLLTEFEASIDGRIDVLEERMDTFASLPDGSTAGDAELLDIRVGANGITYPSAGDAVRGQYSANKAQIDTNTGNISTNALDITTLKGRMTYAEGAITDLQAADTSLGNRITANEGDIVDLKAEDVSLDGRLDTLEGKMSTAEDDIDTLEGKMSTAESDIDNLESAVSTLGSSVSDLSATATYQGSQITALGTRMGTAETQVSQLSGRVTVAENAIEALDDRLDTAESDIDDNTDEITALKTRMSTAEGTISSQGTRLTTAEGEIDDLQAADVSLDSRLDTAETDISGLKTRMTSAETGITGLGNTKADKESEAPLLVAGGARGLLYGKITDKEPYNSRTTAAGKAVGNWLRFKSLVGGTLAMNQIFGKQDATINTNGISISYSVSTNKLTIIVSSEPTGFAQLTIPATGYIISGHKYFIHTDSAIENGIQIYSGANNGIRGSASAPANQTVIDNATSTVTSIFIYVAQTTTPGTYEYEVKWIDLTTSFGSIPQTVGGNSYNSIGDYLYGLGNASGSAWLYKYFPELENGHIPFIAPNLESVCCDKHTSTFSGTTYSYDMGHETLRGIYMLDSAGNLYLDPEKNDTKTPDGEITRRRARVDMGTLNWQNIQLTGGSGFKVEGLGIDRPANNMSICPIICSKYLVTSMADVYANEVVGIGVYSNVDTLVVRDASYATKEAFKTAMSGVYLEYPLATATTESGEPYTELQKCQTGGTETLTDYEVTQGNRLVPVPVGHIEEFDRDIAPALAAFLDILPSADGQYLLDITSGVMSFAAYTPSEAASLSMSRPDLSENVLDDITENPGEIREEWNPEEIPEEEFPDVDTEESR